MKITDTQKTQRPSQLPEEALKVVQTALRSIENPEREAQPLCGKRFSTNAPSTAATHIMR
ncbi:MAG: hypothetical protein S4CHLAM81_11830 [Chlamydiales bacterium]|nr:hypothetical protein [Chlamydiales bacterium]MCH9635959.1 hypothetical protein [Chlamydiales bacterium]MCH9703239.1 hypothetical protein [Chlamydiota bacterium]